MKVSVIIPTHRSLQAVAALVQGLTNRDRSYLKEIIVVLDGASVDTRGIRELRVSENEDPSIIFLSTGSSRGASAARNIGTASASGDILLYIDSDVAVSPGIVSAHASQYERDPSIVGVAGVTRFYSTRDSPLVSSVLASALLYPYSMAEAGKKLYWGPTSNMSFWRRSVGAEPFDERFPRKGGGEDIFIGLATLPRGNIVGAPDAVVSHEVWPGVVGVLKRFFRWGWADAQLLSVVRSSNTEVTLRVRLPSTTILTGLMAAVALSLAGVIEQRSLVVGLPFIFLVVSLLSNNIVKYFRRRKARPASFVALAIGSAYALIFDLGCVSGRWRRPIPDLFQEVRLFPEDVDIYRAASRRALGVNAAVFVVLLGWALSS